MNAPCFGNVEYGYRPRATVEDQEEQIREAQGN